MQCLSDGVDVDLDNVPSEITVRASARVVRWLQRMARYQGRTVDDVASEALSLGIWDVVMRQEAAGWRGRKRY